MLTVEEAFRIVIDNKATFGTETLPLHASYGRVLHEDICADRPLPPFDRVTMDGIAIDSSTYQKGQRTFKIESVAAAGKPQKTLQNLENCVEVMTGAMLPNFTDTIIRYEDLTIENGWATVMVETVVENQNVHFRGQDRAENEVIVAAGRQLSAAEIGVAASVGKPFLTVCRKPTAVIISTGDELVAIDQTPLPHQIRTSNSYALNATLQSWNVASEMLHLIDDYDLIERELARCIDQFDIIILTGGVSAGKFDFVPKALEALNVEKLFHKVAQRPGKPFWFGKARNGRTVFALPGNPVSTFMCLHRYFKPWLDASIGKQQPTLPSVAALTETIIFEPQLSYFLQVKIKMNEFGQLLAQPVAGNGSGDLANLADADAFIELPNNDYRFLKGQLFEIYDYR